MTSQSTSCKKGCPPAESARVGCVRIMGATDSKRSHIKKLCSISHGCQDLSFYFHLTARASKLSFAHCSAKGNTPGYQIWHACFLTIGEPVAQANAALNSGMFETMPFTRKCSSGCGSVMAW